MKKFVDVILPLPLANHFTYSLPDEFSERIEIGCRVIVPFGRKKFYTAIVINIHYCPPQEYETKDICEILDEHPILLLYNINSGSGLLLIIYVLREMYTKPHYLRV